MMRFLSKMRAIPDSVDDLIGIIVLAAIPYVVGWAGIVCGAGW